MTGRAWRREERPEVAIDRILDAADEAFATLGVTASGMAEIAERAACSRGTLYRYFPNRHALHLAYVDRAARAIGERVRAEIAEIPEPRARLIAGVQAALREVRRRPGTAAWFAPDASGAAARMSRASEVVEALATSFTARLLGPVRGRDLRARWLVRVILSLLEAPADDAAQERALLERFVAPVLVGGEAARVGRPATDRRSRQQRSAKGPG